MTPKTKMSVLPNLPYTFHAIPILDSYLVAVDKLILKVYRETKDPLRIANMILKEENGVGGLMVLFSRLPERFPFKATGITTVPYWQKQQTDGSVEWNIEPRHRPIQI